jgi:hypothetical protein
VRQVDLKDASTAQIAEELRERGWRIVPSWVFALLSGGINAGVWTTPERTFEE